MNKPRPIRPKFIVRNKSQKAIRVLGGATITPGTTADLFKIINRLSEFVVIDALREPDGDLYREIWQLGNLELLDCSLVSFGNDWRLNAGEGQPNKALMTDQSGAIVWKDLPKQEQKVDRVGTVEIVAEEPLRQEGNSLYLPKADQHTSGYLSK